jgi:hypothetical protein
MTLMAAEMTLTQLVAWAPVGFVGAFVKKAVAWKPGKYAFMQGLLMVVGLIVMGGLIHEVSWAFGILPFGLAVVIVLEVRRQLLVVKTVK